MATYTAPYHTEEATGTNTSYGFILYSSNSTLNSLVEENIPRFSRITSAVWKLKCKRGGGTGSFYHTDHKWTIRDADKNNIGTLNSGTGTITTSYKDFSQEYASYFYSETENAGKINTNLVDSFGFYCSGTLSRTYTVKERRVEYTFDKPKVIINTSKNINGGLITGSNTYEVEVANYSVTLTAAPEKSYEFVKWIIDGKEYTTKDVSIVISQNNISAHETTINAVAYFKVKTITVTISASPVEGGTVAGGGSYESGQTITISATPNTGYEFSHWDDGNTQNPRTVTVTDNKTYTATFKKIMIYIGDKPIKEIYIGTNKVKEVYIGTTKIYG